MYKTIKERGRAASDYYAGREEYFSSTPAGLTLLQSLEPLIKDHCRGRVLDAGAGRGAYRGHLLNYAENYVGMDIGQALATNVVGDAQRLPFADSSFDTVFCSQVLEHIPEPWLALAEFKRVLRPGGKLILSVPHISWLHNEPHDYYRYTRYGLSFLLERAGFKGVKVDAAGGLFSMLGHIVSVLMVNLTFGVPFLHSMIMRINKIFAQIVASIDQRVEKKKIFALNYICLGQKYLEGQDNDC